MSFLAPVAAGAAKEILKKAITRVLAKKAAQGVSSKVLIKKIMEEKTVKEIAPKQKDVAQELYKFYKRNPKVDTSVKVSKGTPVKPADIVAARSAARAERIRAGVSPARVKPPKKSAASEITDREKAMARAALKRERKATAKTTKVETKADKKQVANVNIKKAVEVKDGSIRVQRPTGKAAAAEKQSLKKSMEDAYKNDGKSTPTIESRELARASDDIALRDEAANIRRAIASLTKEEKAAFRLAEERVKAGIKPRKPDMPKPKPVKSVEERLAAAQKKLTPAQIKKIKALVAETRRRAGA